MKFPYFPRLYPTNVPFLSRVSSFPFKSISPIFSPVVLLFSLPSPSNYPFFLRSASFSLFQFSFTFLSIFPFFPPSSLFFISVTSISKPLPPNPFLSNRSSKTLPFNLPYPHSLQSTQLKQIRKNR